MSKIMQHCFGSDYSGGPVNAFNRLIQNSKFDYSVIRQINPARGFNKSLINSYVKEIEKNEPQLIHIRGLGGEGFHAAVAAKIAGVPNILVSIHGTHRDLQYHSNPIKKWIMVNIFERLTLNFATDIVTVCEYASKRKFLDPYKKKMRGWISNGVPIPRLISANDKMSIKNELNINENFKIGICVSRVTVEKGYIVLAESLKIIDKAENKFTLLIVGGGDDNFKIRSYYSDLKFIEVKFLGHTNDVGKYLSISDFFIFPSLHENLSNALIEAMSYQIPVIATNVGGNTEVVQKGGGLLVNPSDPHDLAKKIEFYIDNTDILDKLGKLARNNIKENYSLDSMIKSWESLYKTILDKEEL